MYNNLHYDTTTVNSLSRLDLMCRLPFTDWVCDSPIIYGLLVLTFRLSSNLYVCLQLRTKFSVSCLTKQRDRSYYFVVREYSMTRRGRPY